MFLIVYNFTLNSKSCNASKAV